MHETILARRLRAALDGQRTRDAISFVRPYNLERLTGSQLREEIEAIAADLLRSGAVPESDIRILPMAPCRQLAVDFIGTMLAGVIPVVLDVATSHEASPAFDSIRARVRSAGFGLIGSSGKRYEASSADRTSPQYPLRLLQATSGTTSAPRLCMWGEPQIIAAVERMAAAMAFTPSDLAFCWASLSHQVGSLNNLLFSLLNGGRLALMDPELLVSAPRRWLEGLTETRATITSAPNFAIALTLRALEKEDLTGIDLSRVRAIWNAGERIDVGQYRAFGDRLASVGLHADALRTNYGLSEHGPATYSGPGGIVLWSEATQANVVEHATELTVSSASIACVGVSAPGVKVRIRDDRGRVLGDGEIGEITLSSSSLFLGYLGDQTATAVVLRDGVLWTGDTGYTRNGRLFWMGRAREMINIRGRKYDPQQFREALTDLIGDRPSFAAFGIDDPSSGTQGAVLVVELDSDTDPAVQALKIRRVILERLGISLKDIVTVPVGTLQPTRSGKQRHAYYRDVYLTGAFGAAAT